MLFEDFWSLPALVPGAATLLASGMAIHSLIQPAMTKGRKILCGIYALATILLTCVVVYFGATQHEQTREQTAQSTDINSKLDRLRALMGNNPNLAGPQVLQGMIERFSKPYDITDPQTSRLADELFIVKAELPDPITITFAPNDQSANVLSWKLSSVFARAGIKFRLREQTPSSPSETGIMFAVSDQLSPPPVVLKLQRIFDLVNITTKIVNANKADIGGGDFNIFVGPKPI